MAYNLKDVMANKPSRFTAGHRMCAGCGAPVVGRMILRALKEDDQDQFRSALNNYIKMYSFVVQVIRMFDADLEKFFFVGNIFKKHPTHTVINQSPVYFVLKALISSAMLPPL